MKRTKVLTPELKRGLLKWLAGGLVFVGIILVIAFAAAGRLDWPNGQLYGLLQVGCFLLMAAILIPIDPDLLLERSQIKDNAKKWDLVVVRVMNISANLITPLVAGLGVRFGWSAASPMPGWFTVAAAVMMVVSMLFQIWAMASNTFFSPVVRIQNDRGHTVSKGGPYRYVRHPGYLGMFFYFLSVPLLLGSWWALIPAGISLAALVLRTGLEDRTLQAELKGYPEYSGQVRYRLFPGVW